MRGPGRTAKVAGACGLLILPVLLGFGLGWYGLDGLQEERVEPVAALSHELLASFPDGTLVVEIAAPPGELPAASAVNILWARMNETLSKNLIRFQLETYSQSSTGALGTSELFNLEAQVRTTWPTLGTMSLFYLFVDGSYNPDPSVLGLSYAASSIAVFPRVIPGGPDAGVEATVLVHEFGHEIGLVGLVGGAPNEDMAHPGHSTDPSDVMYWQVETTGVLSGLLGGQGPPNQFDAADLADLQTVRATPIPQEILPWAVAGACAAAAVAVVLWGRPKRPRRRATSPSTPGEPGASVATEPRPARDPKVGSARNG
ncbi:MAG TPA: hypothetical protein VEY07_05640 [Thermoplasmata archaeon]|nr:hypothetical protein [Thermoplasmata archaeon]